jgi:hypothetical protein
MKFMSRIVKGIAWVIASGSQATLLGMLPKISRLVAVFGQRESSDGGTRLLLLLLDKT